MRFFKKDVQMDGLTLQVTVDYDKGGRCYITGEDKQRGYTMVVVPVEIKNYETHQIRTTSAWSGYKKFLLEVPRKSKKYDDQALELAKEHEERLCKLVAIKNTSPDLVEFCKVFEAEFHPYHGQVKGNWMLIDVLMDSDGTITEPLAIVQWNPGDKTLSLLLPNGDNENLTKFVTEAAEKAGMKMRE